MRISDWSSDVCSSDLDLAAFVAEQLGLHVTDLANYAARDQTMTDHARELAMRAGLRGPTRADIPFMLAPAAKTAWATDQGMTIAIGVVTALREARIILPSIPTTADRKHVV